MIVIVVDLHNNDNNNDNIIRVTSFHWMLRTLKSKSRISTPTPSCAMFLTRGRLLHYASQRLTISQTISNRVWFDSTGGSFPLYEWLM